VMVWDIGYYYLGSEKEMPSAGEIRKRINKGSLKLYLQGVKLKGYFNLVKAGKSDKEEWFFMKAPEDIDDQEYDQRSALTGRTMEEIAGSAEIWNSEKGKKESNKKKNTSDPAPEEVDKAKKTTFPEFIKPMLATLTTKAFSGDDWVFELKYDGYRVIT